MNDNEIVDLFLSRNEKAISCAAELYGAKLRSIAYGILNDRESAEECENDTYWEAWKRIPPHEPRHYLFSFLGRITRMIAINRYRERQRQKRNMETCELTREMLECIPAQSDTVAGAEVDDLRKMIEHFLDDCPQEQQIIFMRRYWYCDSVSQISAMYGFSESKIKTTLFRMRAKMKEYLEKGGYHV
ncbi:MAG: RNA polymerase sigma factor [Lachnospiraceae bacterium]|nr:RNA polymerase sigma factor [Lachnospiraceae bacterium]